MPKRSRDWEEDETSTEEEDSLEKPSKKQKEMGILKKISKLEDENKKVKLARSELEKKWKSGTLKECLYNTYKDGIGVPSVSDIDQGSYSNLDYIFQKNMLADCFLLTNLMGLAKNNPKLITSELIKIKSDNEVEVGFYEVERFQDTDTKELESQAKVNLTAKFSKEGSTRKYYSVKKDEAINWKTSHNALWPVVVEIAFAKFIQDSVKNSEDQQKILKSKLEETIIIALKDDEMIDEDELKKRVDAALAKALSKDADFRQFLGVGGIAAQTLTALTGKDCTQKALIYIEGLNERGVTEGQSKAFPEKGYSTQEINIYNGIESKLKSKKIITVSFKGHSPAVAGMSDTQTDAQVFKADAKQKAITVMGLVIKLKSDSAERTVEALIQINALEKQKYKNWLKKHKLTSLGELKKADDDIIKSFVLETVDFTKLIKISKTKKGVGARHAYLILGTQECGGYKYIILKNPHDIKTKINYSKSKKLPKTIELPTEIDREKNECSMELGHFCKKLNTIGYDD